MISETVYIEPTPGTAKSPAFNFLNLFKRWMLTVVIITAIVQCLIFSTPENMFAVSCVTFSWILTNKFVLTRINFTKYTFSTIIILGYSLTQQCLPLIFTLLEAKPIVFNLKLPYTVFIHSQLALIILLVSHQLYKSWRNGFGYRFHYTLSWSLKKTHFFTPPTDSQLWTIGMIGITAMIVNFIAGNHYDGSSEERGVMGKLFQGLLPYAYAPFFIVLKPLFSSLKVKNSKGIVFKLILFAILLLGISIGGNSRALFMKGITALGIAYLIGLFLNKFDHKIFKLKNFILVFGAIWLMTGPLSDLGTAMVIVRQHRTDLSSAELLTKTLAAYQDKDAIRLHKAAVVGTVKDWDETYFNNIFLSRFCNLKFNDASLELANEIGDVDKGMLQYSIDRFWATLPSPILSILQINVDKETIASSSFGDYLYYRADQRRTLGGYRSGHFAGTGMASFGWWYLLIFGIGIIFLFFLIDTFVVYNRKNTVPTTSLSLAGLIQITSLFTFLGTSTNSESVVNIYTFLLRGWLQMALLYWVVFFFTRKLSFLK